MTTRFDSQTMAELNVSVEILGFRSLNAMIHQLVMQKIREAKSVVSPEQFSALVEIQIEETQQRSRIKSRERLEMIGELAPHSAQKMPMFEVNISETKKKKTG